MIKPPRRIFEHLGILFSYPEEGLLFHLESAEELLRDRSDLQEQLAPLANFVRTSQIEEVEECFTQTFDLNANNCLEVGWHLYGEDYKRGQLLVRMRSALAEHGIAETVELPDHLRHCLLLLSRLDDEESQLFVDHYVTPALVRIAKGLEAKNPYKSALEVLLELVTEVGERPREVLRRGAPPESEFELPVLNDYC